MGGFLAIRVFIIIMVTENESSEESCPLIRGDVIVRYHCTSNNALNMNYHAPYRHIGPMYSQTCLHGDTSISQINSSTRHVSLHRRFLNITKIRTLIWEIIPWWEGVLASECPMKTGFTALHKYTETQTYPYRGQVLATIRRNKVERACRVS